MPPHWSTLRKTGPYSHRLTSIQRWQGADRAGLLLRAARNAEFHPLPFRIGLGFRDQQPQPVQHEGDLLALHCRQLRPAERPGIAEEEQGPVAAAGQATVTGGDELGDLRCRERRSMTRRRPVLSQDATATCAGSRDGRASSPAASAGGPARWRTSAAGVPTVRGSCQAGEIAATACGSAGSGVTWFRAHQAQKSAQSAL